MKWILVALITITLAGAHAQKKSCCKPPAFSFADLPEAKPQPGHGTCEIPVFSKVDSVQYYANQGINMHFSFNNYESFMAFYKSYQLDTNCVSCLLGCLLSMEEEGEQSELYDDLFDKAVLMYQDPPVTSEFERAWLDLEIGPIMYKRKHQAAVYEQKMHEFYADFEANPVVLALYIAYLDDGMIYKDEPYPNTELADSILAIAIENFYDYAGVLHMGIHLYEDFYPPHSLPLAEKIVETAPNSGHIVHMPGHAYYFNGLYDKAIESFKKSYLVDSIFNAKNKYAADLNWNFIHNMDFLSQVLTEEGRIREAKEWNKKLMLATNKWNNGIGGEVNPKLHTAPMLVQYRLMRWQKASKEAEAMLDQDIRFDDEYYLKGMKLFYDGMYAFEQDHDDTLAIIIDKLKKHAKTGKKLYKKNGEKLGLFYTSSFIDLLHVHKRILQFLYENKDESVDEEGFDINRIEHDIWDYQLSDPPAIPILFEELLAVLYEKQRNFAKAIEVLEEAISRKPNSGPILLHLARMYYRNGQKTESKKYLNKFHEAWGDADQDLIEFEKARVLQINLDK